MCGQPFTDVRGTQIAQWSVAKPIIGNTAKLPSPDFTKSRQLGSSLPDTSSATGKIIVNHPTVREKVHAIKDLLAAVALEIDRHRALSTGIMPMREPQAGHRWLPRPAWLSWLQPPQ